MHRADQPSDPTRQQTASTEAYKQRVKLANLFNQLFESFELLSCNWLELFGLRPLIGHQYASRVI